MADNLNTSYLGQLQGSDNLNTPFLPETASEATINLRSDLSVAGRFDAQGEAVLASTLAVTGTVTGAEATFAGINSSSVITSTDGGGDFGSIATAANDTAMPDGAFRFVQTASGISLAYRSGSTTYYMNSSDVSEA